MPTPANIPAANLATPRAILEWLDRMTAQEEVRRQARAKAEPGRCIGKTRVQRVCEVTRECVLRFGPTRRATPAEAREIAREARFGCHQHWSTEVPDLDAPIPAADLARILYNTVNHANTAGNLG